MKSSKLYLLSAVLTCLTGTVYTAHITETRPIEPVVTRFEILSQNLADQQNNKSLNLPVMIRKDIDAFVEDIGRVPEQKDKDAMLHLLTVKYKELLIAAITSQLDVRPEADAPTLRQLLQAMYTDEPEQTHAGRFAQDLITGYINRSKPFAKRVQETTAALKKNIVDFAIYKNALLASLFDFKKIIFDLDDENTSDNVLSTDGSLLLNGINILKRYGDEYRLQDQLKELRDKYYVCSDDLSVIVFVDDEAKAVNIYTLQQKIGKWALAQTIPYDADHLYISGDGSIIFILVDQRIVHTYVREGKLWREKKELILGEEKNYVYDKHFFSPDGLVLTVRNYNKQTYATYQWRGTHWAKLSEAPDRIQKRSARLYNQQKLAASHSPEPPFIIVSNDDGDIFAKGDRGRDIYTRYGDNWYFAQTLDEGGDAMSSDGLVLFQEQGDTIYVIPMAAREAAKILSPKQWQFINYLYGAHLQALSNNKKGHVILDEEQRQLFNTLPLIFQQAINSKWRVPEEEQVQAYKESKELKSEASRRAGCRPSKRTRTAGS